MIIGRGKVKYSQRNLSHCLSVHHTFHTDCPGMEPRLPEWEVGDKLPES